MSSSPTPAPVVQEPVVGGRFAGLTNLVAVLAQVPDPRTRRGRRHPLPGLLVVAVCSVLGGARSFAAIAQWRRPPCAAPRRADERGDLRASHLIATLDHATSAVLGQLAVAAKSNEIPAVRTLLASFDAEALSGAVVTVDAMHTQTDTATAIIGAGADYVFTVKGNQPVEASGRHLCGIVGRTAAGT